MLRNKNKLEIDELTMLLIYLTSWVEESRKKIGTSQRKGWRGYSFSSLNDLQEKKLIQYKLNNNMLFVTPEGEKLAKELIEKYHLPIYE